MTQRPRFLADGMSALALEIAVTGFAALWRGDARDPNDLVHAERSSVDEVIAALIERGRCEVEHGRLVGIHGLTLRPTRHQFVHADRLRHTWCAFDAVGIPAALQIDATTRTDCPTCQRPLRVDIRAGDPVTGADLVLWLPAAMGEHLMESFCAAADVYCSLAHLEQRIDAATADGEIVDLDRAAALGRETWADVTIDRSVVRRN